MPRPGYAVDLIMLRGIGKTAEMFRWKAEIFDIKAWSIRLVKMTLDVSGSVVMRYGFREIGVILSRGNESDTFRTPPNDCCKMMSSFRSHIARLPQADNFTGKATINLLGVP